MRRALFLSALFLGTGLSAGVITLYTGIVALALGAAGWGPAIGLAFGLTWLAFSGPAVDRLADFD